MEEPFTHTCLPLMANTAFEPSRAAHPHMLCHRTAAPEPCSARTGALTHRAAALLACVVTCLASMVPWNKIQGSVQGVQTGTSLRTLLLTMLTLCKALCRLLLQLHYFFHVNLYPISKPFVHDTCTMHSVCCIQDSIILLLQPARTSPPKHTSPRNTHTGSVPWPRAALQLLQFLHTALG